jgi:hypothetical protein
MEMAVRRALGGTSWLWGGRCIPFSDLDFTGRDFVPDSKWPIGHEDVKPWYELACHYMGCGGHTFQIPFDRELKAGLTVESIERWTTEPRLTQVYREHLRKSKQIKICLNSTMIDLDLGANGQSVDAIVVATEKGRLRIRARRVVLATGGVEATRLLLAVQRRWPDHFGGTGGPLGRYYMGHLSGTITSLVFDDPASIADYNLVLDSSGAYRRRRFALTEQTQLQNKLLNCGFWLGNPQFSDPRHGSGVLSAYFLALAIPPIGRRAQAASSRPLELGPKPYPIRAHLMNIVRDGPQVARDLGVMLRDLVFKETKKRGYAFPNRAGRFALYYHGEQIPNPNNRIFLTNELDRHGLPRARVDFRFFDEDARSIVDTHHLLDLGLQANRIGHLEFQHPPDRLESRVMELAKDGRHQVGTTRMGDDPRDSVVDQNLKVHGVDNLYVVSTSVYRTDGQANSTLLAVALAMRLADHLNSTVGNLDELALPSQRRTQDKTFHSQRGEGTCEPYDIQVSRPVVVASKRSQHTSGTSKGRR